MSSPMTLRVRWWCVHHGERQLLATVRPYRRPILMPHCCGDLPAGSGELVLVLGTRRIKSPVLMFTGSGSGNMPSTAQVSMCRSTVLYGMLSEPVALPARRRQSHGAAQYAYGVKVRLRRQTGSLCNRTRRSTSSSTVQRPQIGHVVGVRSASRTPGS